MNPAFAGALAASIGVPLVLVLLAKMFPATSSEASRLSPRELRAKYLKWDVRLGLIFFGLTLALTLAFYPVLQRLAIGYTRFLPAADETFTMVPIYWLLPAMLLGILCAIPTTSWIAARMMKNPYAYSEFVAYQRTRHLLDPIAAERFIACIVAVACAALIFFGLDSYLMLQSDTLVVNGYRSIRERRYDLKTVRQIRTAARFHAPNGKIVARREFVVTFDSGDRWATNFIPGDPPPDRKRAFVERVASRSGVLIREVGLFQTSDLY